MGLSDSVDVCVVGGGYSGLSAAWALHKLGHSVMVCEARERVGGRAWTEKVPGGGWIDHGGQWIGPGQSRILELASELGVGTFPTFQDGQCILVFNGERVLYSAEDPTKLDLPIPQADNQELLRALAEIDQLSKTVPPHAPWEAPRAREWDTQTAATWIKENLKTDGARFVLQAAIVGYFSVEPADMSFLHFLFYISAGGGLEALEESSLAWRFDGGAQEIPDRLADRMGDSVQHCCPVRKIDQSGENVTVHTDNGTVAAKQVIVAVSPQLASRIQYEPMLPPSRDQYMQRTPLGSVIKCHAVYPRAFWRDHNFNGQLVSDDEVNATFDNSPENGVPGILVGFLEGTVARNWHERSERQVREKMLATFVEHFGEQAGEPLHFYYANWGAESWSRGCYAGIPTPGTWVDYRDAVRKPVGRIHWAGTETATGWTQYMEGAVRAGQRAATEAHAALSNQKVGD